MLDIIDVDQISSTIARDCSKLRELGGRALSAETTTDAPPSPCLLSLGCPELVRRYQQGCAMLKHLLIEVIGHVSGLSDAQLEQIERSLPATKALIDLLSKAHPIIEQAETLYKRRSR